jgi:hypothetical protein
MIIKRWDASLTTPAWVNESPKTTASSIFTNSVFNVGLFDGNSKLKPEYLPDAALGGLTLIADINNSAVDTEQKLVDLIHAQFIQTQIKANVGKYWIASQAVTGIMATAKVQTTTGSKFYCIDFTAFKEEDQAGGQTTAPDLEAGDWLIITSVSGDGTSDIPYRVELSVINNTYQDATHTARGIVKLFSNAPQPTAANAVTDTADKTYGIQFNGDGQLVVNVPWVNTVYTHATHNGTGAAGVETTLTDITLIDSLSLTNGHIDSFTHRKLVAGTNVTITPASNGNITIASQDTTYVCATTSTFGLVKLSHDKLAAAVTTQPASDTAARYYGVQATTGDQLIVNVPWVNTTYVAATDAVLGLVKLGYAQANTQVVVSLPVEASKASARQYGIQIDGSGNASVYVPWTDNNTTYSAGNGIALNGSNQFSVAAGIGLTQEASGLKMTQPYLSQAAASTPVADYQVANNLWFAF